MGSACSRARKFGGYASQVASAATDVVALPEELTFEQGAAIPVNYATAWAALIGYGSLQPGERVLVHSAGGGVGIAATQIAKHAGAEVYGTASPGKHARILELGVDHALDYTKPGWESGLPQFDVILDAVGGKSFRKSYSTAAPGGRLVAFGASSVVSGERENVGHGAARGRAHAALQHDQADVRIEGRDRAEHAHAVEGPRHAAAVGRPAAASCSRRHRQTGRSRATFAFEEAGAAQTMIVERRNVGKVVLTP